AGSARGWLGGRGGIAERSPPWFHERHVLPGWLGEAYAGTLRRLSAAPRLPPPSPGAPGSWQRKSCHTLVAGGGIAGLTAAAALAASGRDVLVVEAAQLGGSALHRADTAAVARSLAVTLHERGIKATERSVCLGLYDDARTMLVMTPDGPVAIGMEALVVATGAYDRILPFAGNDLP